MATREPSPSAQFAALLSRFPPEIVALAKRCLPKLRRAVPCSFEIVYDYRHSVVVAMGLSEKGYEALVALAIHPEAVKLYFNSGKDLPDPKGLLEGSASKVRSVTLKSASDLDHPDIKALFKAAVEHAGVSFPARRTTSMIIKTSSKQKKPRKAAGARRG